METENNTENSIKNNIKNDSAKNDALTFSKAELEKIDEAYSSEPWWYDLRGFLILTFAYRTTLPAQIKLFGSHFGAKHLEVAIGTGTLFEMVLKWRKWKKLPNVEILGFDYAERMLAGAKRRFRKEKQVSLLRADVAALPIKENTFDSANIANAIHCLPDIRSGFQEIHRVLKPGGALVGNCLLEPRGHSLLDWISRKINTWGIKKGILYRPYQATEVLSLLTQTGFQVSQQEITGNCLNFVATKVK